MTRNKKKIIIIAAVVVVALIVGTFAPYILQWPYRDAEPLKGAESPDFDLSSMFLTYGFEDGYLSVKKGSSADKVKVSDIFFGLPVTHIGSGAFKDKTKLSDIILPGALMGIAEEAFSGCTSLSEIVIPMSLNSVGRNAFNGCTSLTSITLPGSVEISGLAFNGCTSLKSVTILDGETAISSNAFKGCTALSEIRVPDDIKSIDANAFAGCDNIVFSKYDNALYLGNEENPYVALICAVDQSITSCEIHPDTKIFADEAFLDCFLLETFTYRGTIEEWNCIGFPFSWDLGTGAYTIYCADGEI